MRNTTLCLYIRELPQDRWGLGTGETGMRLGHKALSPHSEAGPQLFLEVLSVRYDRQMPQLRSSTLAALLIRPPISRLRRDMPQLH